MGRAMATSIPTMAMEQGLPMKVLGPGSLEVGRDAGGVGFGAGGVAAVAPIAKGGTGGKNLGPAAAGAGAGAT